MAVYKNGAEAACVTVAGNSPGQQRLGVDGLPVTGR